MRTDSRGVSFLGVVSTLVILVLASLSFVGICNYQPSYESEKYDGLGASEKIARWMDEHKESELTVTVIKLLKAGKGGEQDEWLVEYPHRFGGSEPANRFIAYADRWIPTGNARTALDPGQKVEISRRPLQLEITKLISGHTIPPPSRSD